MRRRAGETQNPFPLLTSVSRLLAYPFVLVVGTTFFLAWLWPRASVEVFIRSFYGGSLLAGRGHRGDRRVRRVRLFSDAFTGRSGAAALARLAVLAVGVGFAWEILGDARRRRVPITIWQLALAETFVVGSDAWQDPGWSSSSRPPATWARPPRLGGLLALAAILVPSVHLEVLHDVPPRFFIAIVSVITLVVTGRLHALAIAGRGAPWSGPATACVRQQDRRLRRHAPARQRRAAVCSSARPSSRTEIDESASDQSIRAFAVAVGAEFALATVFAATAALVHFGPTP